MQHEGDATLILLAPHQLGSGPTTHCAQLVAQVVHVSQNFPDALRRLRIPVPQFQSVDYGAEITVGVCENRPLVQATGSSTPEHRWLDSSGRGGTGRIATWPTAFRQASRPAWRST